MWLGVCLLCCASLTQAQVSQSTNSTPEMPQRIFSLLLYQPNYILPLSLSTHQSSAASSSTLDHQSPQNLELNFQFSVKTPIVNNIAGYNNTLYIAYTQLSFWQAYHPSPFFRETNYQPEIFLQNRLHQALGQLWQLQTVNIGAMHQSNGAGGSNERSWNRVYAEGNFTDTHWRISVKPWYILPDASMEDHNDDIGHYLGHGQVSGSYQVGAQVWALSSYGLENAPHRTSMTLTWSHPLIEQFHWYGQIFSGYGQSLIDYNHHVNSVGVGISLS